MSDTLFIRLLDGQSVEWVKADKHGNLSGEPVTCALSDVQKPEDPRCHIIVFVPSFHVSLHAVKIPSNNRKQQLQAVPFALEDHLVEDVEQYFFAVANKRTANKLLPVAVVRRVHLTQWLELLNTVNLQPNVMLPDVFALEYEENAYNAYEDGNKTLIRTGEFSGFAIETQNVELILAEYADKKKLTPGKSLLAQAAHQQWHKPALNLLQGDFRSKKAQTGLPWYTSKTLFIVLIIVLIVAVILGKGARYAALHHTVSKQRQQMTQIYQQSFPNTQLPLDPKSSMTQRLQQLRQAAAGDPVMQAITKVGKVLQQYPGLTLHALQYDNKRLTVVLPIVNLDWQHKLVSGLQSQGLKLDYAYKDKVLTLKVKV